MFNDNSVLYIYLLTGNRKCVDFFIKCGIDCNVKNNYGKTAFIYAIASGYDIMKAIIFICVELRLFEAGVDV